MNNQRLNEIFEAVAKNYGFERAEAEFVTYKDFKVRWTRSYKWIEITVSDYLKSAPENVVKDILEVLLSKIKGDSAEYDDATNEYLTSKEFREANLKTFLKRMHFTVEHPDANGIREILDEEGIDIPDLMIVKGAGYNSSALFRVLAVPDDYDDMKVVEKANSIIDGLVMFKAIP